MTSTDRQRLVSLTERLWKHTARDESANNCWEWQAACDTVGYGLLWKDTRQIGAHRVSWELHYGPIPDGLHVLHRCDNRRCVRPDHLFLGTPADNARDREAKGRGHDRRKYANPLRGSQCHWAKLTDAQVLEIRARWVAGGVTQRQLGREYGVDSSIICRVVNGERWIHVKALQVAG